MSEESAGKEAEASRKSAAKPEQKAKPEPKTIRVRAEVSFGNEATGDMRSGEEAVLERSDKVLRLVGAGYLSEVAG